MNGVPDEGGKADPFYAYVAAQMDADKDYSSGLDDATVATLLSAINGERAKMGHEPLNVEDYRIIYNASMRWSMVAMNEALLRTRKREPDDA